jgi:hypothetical protein
MSETNPTAAFSCPLCNKTCKVTKTGKIARHGHRRMYGSEWNHCPTSGLTVEAAYVEALAVLGKFRAQCDAGIGYLPSGKERKLTSGERTGLLRSVDKDIARVHAQMGATS